MPVFNNVMREFAAKFYKSEKWKSTKKAYSKSVGGLCERCLSRGLITAGEIVHHKKHIEPWNINDPTITLSWDNLELLCRSCHGQAHSRYEPKRYFIDADGNVKIK